MSYYGDSKPVTSGVTDAILAPYRDEVNELKAKKRTLQAYTALGALLGVLFVRMGRRA